MHALEPGDLLILGAVMMLGGGVFAYLFGQFFCARDAPRWMRLWRDVSIALLGARLIGARVFDLPLDWPSGLIYINIGLSQLAIGLYRWRFAVGVCGDRCPNQRVPAT